MTSRSRDTYLAAAAPVLWGTTYWTTTELLPPGRPLTAAVLRALPVGVALAIVLRHAPPAGWRLRALALGALNIGAFFALLFVAAHHLPGGAAATITALQPLFALGLAAWWLAARPTRRQLTAAAAGVVGVGLVVGGATLDVAGVAAALGAAVSMAAGVVLTRRWQPPASPLVLTAWQLAGGGILLLPLALAFEGVPAVPTAAQAAGYLWLAVPGTALAYVLWTRGVQRLPVASVTSLALLSPLTAVTVDWLVLGHALSVGQLAGAVLVLGGVVAAQT